MYFIFNSKFTFVYRLLRLLIIYEYFYYTVFKILLNSSILFKLGKSGYSLINFSFFFLFYIVV